MASSRRPVILLVCLFLTFIFTNLGNCHASRTAQVFKLRPKYQHSGHYLGFLPRRIPIPASGPSRKHNDIGLRSWRSP
ncbi:hypothetical protein ACE6H2_020416 [Prunus campanulata]